MPPSRCAVIEDSLPGILGGIAAGMKVFALQEPHAPADPAEVPAGVVVIHSLHELQEHLIAPERRLQPSSASMR